MEVIHSDDDDQQERAVTADYEFVSKHSVENALKTTTHLSEDTMAKTSYSQQASVAKTGTKNKVVQESPITISKGGFSESPSTVKKPVQFYGSRPDSIAVFNADML